MVGFPGNDKFHIQINDTEFIGYYRGEEGGREATLTAPTQDQLDTVLPYSDGGGATMARRSAELILNKMAGV